VKYTNTRYIFRHSTKPSVQEGLHLVESLEARVGIEPTHKGFAVVQSDPPSRYIQSLSVS
jgi:hypothetical protein